MNERESVCERVRNSQQNMSERMCVCLHERVWSMCVKKVCVLVCVCVCLHERVWSMCVKMCLRV